VKLNVKLNFGGDCTLILKAVLVDRTAELCWRDEGSSNGNLIREKSAIKARFEPGAFWTLCPLNAVVIQTAVFINDVMLISKYSFEITDSRITVLRVIVCAST
jgi:hypothetical protein